MLESSARATISAVARLSRIVLWVVAGIMILQSLGVSVSGLLAFGGVGGIAVGFAARDLLANFLGGLSIFLDRPFAVGTGFDRRIEIEGTVEDVGWRVTRIRTFDQRLLYVPNSVFSTVAYREPFQNAEPPYLRDRRHSLTISRRWRISSLPSRRCSMSTRISIRAKR